MRKTVTTNVIVCDFCGNEYHAETVKTHNRFSTIMVRRDVRYNTGNDCSVTITLDCCKECWTRPVLMTIADRFAQAVGPHAVEY